MLVLGEHVLDLLGAHPHAADLEHVIDSALVGEVTGLVLDVDVARVEPLAQQRLPRELGLPPVCRAHRVTPDHQHTGLAWR